MKATCPVCADEHRCEPAKAPLSEPRTGLGSRATVPVEQYFIASDANGSLAREIAKAINFVSRENTSDTPDWILGEYLVAVLVAFEIASNQRANWWSDGKSTVENPQKDDEDDDPAKVAAEESRLKVCPFPEHLDGTEGTCPAWWRGEMRAATVWQERLASAEKARHATLSDPTAVEVPVNITLDSLPSSSVGFGRVSSVIVPGITKKQTIRYRLIANRVHDHDAQVLFILSPPMFANSAHAFNPIFSQVVRTVPFVKGTSAILIGEFAVESNGRPWSLGVVVDGCRLAAEGNQVFVRSMVQSSSED